MKTVQVAIPDSAYADAIRNLLIEDGRRQVHLVEDPDPALAGVIILDAARLSAFPALANEHKRLLLMAHKDRDDLSKIWDAGVRHVLFYGDSPQTVRVAVLGRELSISVNGVSAG